MGGINQEKAAMHAVGPLPATGFLRERQVLQYFPFSRSTLWSKVRAKTFPAPVKISDNMTAWRSEDIRAEIERLGRRQAA